MTPPPASARPLARALSRRVPRLAVFVAVSALAVRLATPAGATVVTPDVTQAVGTVTSVDVTPFPAATNTSSVTVTITGARDASNNLLNGAAAATMCANADTGGTPLAALPAGNTSCDGTEHVADITFVVFAGGNATFTKTLKASNIGADLATCISGGTIACQFGIGDVATSGAAFAIAIPVFGGGGGGGPATTTTTTVGGTTTSTAPGGTTTTTAAPGGSTTTAAPGSTTSTSTTTTTTKAPSAPVMVATPNTNLADAQKVRLSATGLSAFEGQAVALTQCGNASTAGAPLASVAEADCFGAEAVGTQLFLGTITGGKFELDYVVRRSGIGTNKASCVAAANPCVLALADVATRGEKLRLTAPITFSAPPAPATTSTTAAPAQVLGATQTLGGSGGLAYTGPTARTITMVIVAAVLLELGWMFVTGARRPRRSGT
jgi:hypothetical protein